MLSRAHSAGRPTNSHEMVSVKCEIDVAGLAAGGSVNVKLDVSENKAVKIDGTATAKTIRFTLSMLCPKSQSIDGCIREEIKVKVDEMVAQHNLRPGRPVR